MDDPVRTLFLMAAHEWLIMHGPAKEFTEQDEKFLIAIYNYIIAANKERQ